MEKYVKSTSQICNLSEDVVEHNIRMFYKWFYNETNALHDRVKYEKIDEIGGLHIKGFGKFHVKTKKINKMICHIKNEKNSHSL